MIAQMLHAELTGNPPWPAGHGIVTSIQDMPISRTPYGLALRVDNDQDIPTRILVLEHAVTQVLQVARVAQPEAFTDPVTAHVDGNRRMSRPR